MLGQELVSRSHGLDEILGVLGFVHIEEAVLLSRVEDAFADVAVIVHALLIEADRCGWCVLIILAHKNDGGWLCAVEIV